jgi:hypothetical protein
MRMMPLSPRIFRWLLPLVCLIACGMVAHAQSGNPTTITGHVYSPLGAPPTGTGDPIPNILVYVAQTPVLSFASTVGAGVTGGCAAQANLVSGNPLVTATTDAAGSFTLSGPGLDALGTTTVNVVIQAGKWRRQYPNTPITAGQNTNLALAMPSSQAQGDLPHIAVVTGSADDVECIFKQIGIATATEVTDPSGAGSINLFEGTGTGVTSGGQVVSASSPTEDVLLSNTATLNNYDVVIFGCQGGETDPQATGTTGQQNQANLIAYANAGGRIFATHYGFVWLYNDQPFESTANWDPVRPNIPNSSVSTIDQTYPEGAILAQWLHNINADTGTLGQLLLNNIRADTDSVNNPPAQSWLTANSAPGTPSMQFTFNTPIGSSGIPTVAVTYTNTTTVFQPGDTGDSITVVVTNSSTTDADSSLKLTIAIPGSITVTSLSDPTNGWQCQPALLTCTRTTPLTAGSTDSVVMTFNILSTATLGQASITGSLSGGNLSSTGQCGRVLFNDYHVEVGSTKGEIYPKACSSGLTNQEKFLEFSLYNLSNFVAPTSTDVINIQGLPTLAWTNPLTSIYYGTTPWLTSAQNPTASYRSVAVTGTASYLLGPLPGSPITTATILPVGTDTVCFTFIPTSSNYLPVTTPFCTTITVLPDTTSVTAGAITTPIFYGQTFTVSTPTVTTAGPATLSEGTITYNISNSYIGTQTFCTLTLPAGGTCSLPTIYDAGNYAFQACYADSLTPAEFAPSCSPSVAVVINPDPTTTTTVSNNDPATVGTSVTFTATVADQYYPTPLGTVTFYDGAQIPANILQANVPLNAAGNTATYTTSSFIIGTHNITACYSPSIDAAGTYDFLSNCSPNFIEQVVLVPPSGLGTVTVLNSSANPSIVNTPVTFSVAVATTGSFTSIPGGDLKLYDGTNLLYDTQLTNGDASFTTSSLTVGTHPITAVYAGGSSGSYNYSGSTSTVLNQVVTIGLPVAGTGFLMRVNPTAISVGVGNTATIQVSIAALNNFNQTVQLTCNGLPAEATCNFAQSLIPVGGGITTLTINPAAPHACGTGGPYFVATNGMGTSLPLFALSALGLYFLRKRKRLFQGMALTLALCLLPVLNGCSSNCTDFGTQPGTYTFTVTGTAGGAIAPATSPQVSTQTIQMIVHL